MQISPFLRHVIILDRPTQCFNVTKLLAKVSLLVFRISPEIRGDTFSVTWNQNELIIYSQIHIPEKLKIKTFKNWPVMQEPKKK